MHFHMASSVGGYIEECDPLKPSQLAVVVPVHFRLRRQGKIYLVHCVGQDDETSEILVSKQVSFPFYFLTKQNTNDCNHGRQFVSHFFGDQAQS